jgi:linoleoyl-CoA desaturase
MYIVAYIALPIYFVGLHTWLWFFIPMHLTLGFLLAIVFQLAHVVEETAFESVSTDTMQIENEFAIHQIRTTNNFAMNNALVNWYVGGLNYQIEHHLFPKISHVHYPALSKIVQKHCMAHNIEYLASPTMWDAVKSHWRFMKELGKKPAENQVAVHSLF